MPKTEDDRRSINEKYVYGLAAIREAFRDYPQHESYIESLTMRIIESYGALKANEDQLAISS